MAAISGVVRFDGAPLAGGLVRRIAARMGHRSPHGIAAWDGGAVALAHGALHASPHAHMESQPLRLDDGSLLVADGRIDDRTGLARALGMDAGALRDAGDAALFGRAWLRWGDALWRHVLGDYALAIWQPREARLHLLRDRIGVRPLYWARTARMLAFASEAEALLGIDAIPTEPDPDRLAGILAPAFDPPDLAASLYRGVQRLLPAHALDADAAGSVRVRRCWAFGPLPPLRLRSHADYVDAFRTLFDDAVRVRLASPTTPGLMLSGGIDSAAVHASALGQGLALRRIAVVADQPGAEEERANIETLLAQAPDALRLPVPGLEALVDMPRLAREVFDHAHPVLASILLPMLVYQAAGAAGSRVVLDGIDGDLAMSTPDNYVGRLALAGHPLTAWREARAAARHHTYLRYKGAPRILLGALASRLEPTWSALVRYRLTDALRGDARFRGLLHPDRVAALRLRQQTLAARLARRADPALRTWTGYRLHVWTQPGLMRGMEGFDLAAARFGVEARHPWCDQRVLDFFLQVPMQVLVRQGWTKHLARSAYAPELGTVAWHSGKRHLGPQVTRAVLEAGGPRLARVLAEPGPQLGAWIDPEVLATARLGRAGASHDLARNDLLMELVLLHRWLANLTEAPRAATVAPGV